MRKTSGCFIMGSTDETSAGLGWSQARQRVIGIVAHQLRPDRLDVAIREIHIATFVVAQREQIAADAVRRKLVVRPPAAMINDARTPADVDAFVSLVRGLF